MKNKPFVKFHVDDGIKRFCSVTLITCDQLRKNPFDTHRITYVHCTSQIHTSMHALHILCEGCFLIKRVFIIFSLLFFHFCIHNSLSLRMVLIRREASKKPKPGPRCRQTSVKWSAQRTGVGDRTQRFSANA